LRWVGIRTANRVRTPDRAAAAQSERTAALAQQLVDQLAQMRGAAMKVGQMISMVEFDGLPAEQRTTCSAGLRRSATTSHLCQFAQLEKLMRHEFGARSRYVFGVP
jgi:predicted unusual protein kinase regulating ubiquinone biosynthesis (AarF/ABC1/UbiB family)